MHIGIRHSSMTMLGAVHRAVGWMVFFCLLFIG